MNHLTAAEIAAFLGISAAGVRKVIERHGIEHQGKRGKAHLYDPREVLRHAGVHDRRSA